ncbi:MAG: DNA photolyase family protein [Candidatus Dojkabacteria bacterium]|nr:DNA photolyase family protein [Candidatus Dojkabacteria bacterium]
MFNIIWFRNDLRLKYNKTIFEANKHYDNLIPIFILDNKLLNVKYSCKKRNNFLFESLIDMQNQLRTLGSDLIVIDYDPIEFFKIFKDYVNSVHISRDYSPYSKKRDHKTNDLLGNKLKIHCSNVIFDQNTEKIETKDNQTIKVFTRYKIEWLNSLSHNLSILNLDYIPNFCNPTKIKEFIDVLNKLGIPIINNLSKLIDVNEKSNIFTGGETQAQTIWNEFLKNKIYEYKSKRDFLSVDGTSRLSAHLKFGCISPHQIAYECIKILGHEFYNFRKFQNTNLAGIEHYLSEIIWREFYKYILDTHPYVTQKSFQQKYDNIEWENNIEKFEAWCNGKTGYPIVDACMRQLNEEGWMHNRGRMIVASFLCKDLHIDWRWGEKYFRKKLIDYDLSSNNGGWQWTAGVGTDAAPYFRIYNPTEQSKKFDAECKFIKKYVKELAHLPPETIHNLPEMNENERKILKLDYPNPIVDHKKARERALKLYQNI